MSCPHKTSYKRQYPHPLVLLGDQCASFINACTNSKDDTTLISQCRVTLQSPPTKKTQKKNLTSSNKQSSTKRQDNLKFIYFKNNKIYFQILSIKRTAWETFPQLTANDYKMWGPLSKAPLQNTNHFLFCSLNLSIRSEYWIFLLTTLINQ